MVSTGHDAFDRGDLMLPFPSGVNPMTGLATDYLNVFNEYVMLAELVDDGSLPAECLSDWQPIDYESHFAQSKLKNADDILLAYRALAHDDRLTFETAVNEMIGLILDHQHSSGVSGISSIKKKHESLSAIIAGEISQSAHDLTRSQADIDALFD